MAIIEEIIRLEEDNSISFGNYSVKEKQKVGNFNVNGDMYRVKTHNEITRIEKNGNLLLETVPGAVIHHFKVNEKSVCFSIEGFEDTQITLELEPNKEYKIYVDDFNIGKMKSNFSGKISFSSELKSVPQVIKIEKL